MVDGCDCAEDRTSLVYGRVGGWPKEEVSSRPLVSSGRWCNGETTDTGEVHDSTFTWYWDTRSSYDCTTCCSWSHSPVNYPAGTQVKLIQRSKSINQPTVTTESNESTITTKSSSSQYPHQNRKPRELFEPATH